MIPPPPTSPLFPYTTLFRSSEPLPGVVVITSRFPLSTLERRTHARIISLGSLDTASGRELLRSLGVRGTDRDLDAAADRKSTRLNSSHLGISYAVFCLKKKK